MSEEEKSYLDDANRDATEMAINFLDEIVDQLVNDGEVSKFLDEYESGEEYHRETHCDKWYSLKNAASLLEELEDYEETDSGLWQGLPPRQAVMVMATYTYANAVIALWRKIVEKINDDEDVQEILTHDEVHGEELSPVDEEMSKELALLVLDAQDAGGVSVAADYAEETGSEWADVLRHPSHITALKAAKKVLLTERVKKIIKDF